MNSQKVNTIKHFVIFAVALVLMSCKGGVDDTESPTDGAEDNKNPLEKIYNPKTLSQDLEAISDSNTVIVKNIINAYQKAGESTNRIAGNEVIMIESSTYKQILDNYNQFHSKWKELKQREFVAELDSLMNKKIKTPFLRDNFKVWFLPREVKDPENGYVSFKLLYENLSDKPIKINGSLFGIIIPTDKTIGISPRGGYIPAGNSKTQYVPAYKFKEDEVPNSKTQLHLLLNDSDKFTYGKTEYSLNNISLTERGIDEAVIEEKEKILRKLKGQYKNEFPRTFWPYNTDTFKKKKSKLISKHFNAFTDFLKSNGHI